MGVERDMARVMHEEALEWKGRAIAAEAEVVRLREGVRALHTKGYASTSEEVWGQNPQCDECGVAWPCDTIALLSPSPAATTGEADAWDEGFEAGATFREASGYVGPNGPSDPPANPYRPEWTPAPVSSGEAATGEAVCDGRV